jgi:hypothetical protein
VTTTNTTADLLPAGTRVRVVNPGSGALVVETTVRIPAIRPRTGADDLVWVNTPWGGPATFPRSWVHETEGVEVYVTLVVDENREVEILGVSTIWSDAEALATEVGPALEAWTVEGTPPISWRYLDDGVTRVEIHRNRLT